MASREREIITACSSIMGLLLLHLCCWSETCPSRSFRPQKAIILHDVHPRKECSISFYATWINIVLNAEQRSAVHVRPGYNISEIKFDDRFREELCMTIGIGHVERKTTTTTIKEGNSIGERATPISWFWSFSYCVMHISTLLCVLEKN